MRSWSRSHDNLERESVCRLVRALWWRRTHELRTFGIELLIARIDQLTCDEMALAEWILLRANTWAHVDPMAIQVVGPLCERCPELVTVLDRWAEHESHWLRRSVLLAHLLSLRRGDGEWDRFVAYADHMLEEKEFFIRKAIGWVLRESGRATPGRVVRLLEQRIDRISILSLREAVKHLPAEHRQALLEAYRNR